MLPLRDHLPTRRTPVVNYLLIAANVVAFIWEKALIEAGYHPMRFLMDWGLVPARLAESPAAELPNLFTSMFLHDPSGWAHVGGNMLFLWIFGDNVEDAMGSPRYAAFYLLSGLAAALAQVLIDPGSHIPMIGASGAISGVLAAYGFLYPVSAITVLNPIVPLWFFFGLTFELPAWLVILEYFVVNLWSGIGSLGTRGGGVAFFAHLGGFVAGVLLLRLFMKGRGRRETDRWRGFRTRRGPATTAGRPYGSLRPPPRPRGPWDW